MYSGYGRSPVDVVVGLGDGVQEDLVGENNLGDGRGRRLGRGLHEHAHVVGHGRGGRLEEGILLAHGLLQRFLRGSLYLSPPETYLAGQGHGPLVNLFIPFAESPREIGLFWFLYFGMRSLLPHHFYHGRRGFSLVLPCFCPFWWLYWLGGRAVM